MDKIEFSVSVIIPVFNAEQFIEKAIQSVLIQPEVLEIVVVNDGSTDNSLKIIETLQKQDSKIKIYHHANKENKGRSASRNLGIKKAVFPYIAFLDADDFYLENRFKNDALRFQNNQNIDGVYNAISAYFYREKYNSDSELKLTTVTESIPPNKLFVNLLSGKKGYFSIDGLTVKKSVFFKTGYFVEHLTVAEDTDLILKLSLCCHLESGIINKPLAMRGVHNNNVFNNTDLYNANRDKMYESVIEWAIKNKISSKRVDDLLKWLYFYRSQTGKTLIEDTRHWFKLLKKSPNLIMTSLSIKYFPLIRKRKNIFPFLFKK